MSQITHDMVNSINWNELFTYSNGNIYWREIKGNRKPGPVGTRNKIGYYVFNYKGKVFSRHQVIWVMHNGPIPDEHVIRHINDIKGDDRIENLNIGYQIDNAADFVRSGRLKSSNTSGFRGVSWDKSREQWRVYITVGGKRKSNRYFDDFGDAVAYRLHLEEVYYGVKHEENEMARTS
ncbi:HNH endonuclease [Escherichia coli]|nr:HNH endonuclease [Escherichia coli]